MAGINDYARNKILDQVFSNTAPSFSIATLYFALLTAAAAAPDTGTNWTSGSGGSGKEPSTGASGQYNNYARATSTNNATDWPAASSGSKTNASAAITFPQSTGGTASPVTVGNWGVADAATNGNAFAFGALTVSQSVASGDTPSFAAGAVTITLS